MSQCLVLVLWIPVCWGFVVWVPLVFLLLPFCWGGGFCWDFSLLGFVGGFLLWVLCVGVWGGGCLLLCLVGEFDPGSGRTLAACLTHASRAERPFLGARAA